MGCDIHLYKEKQIDGKWLAADEWTPREYGDEYEGVEVVWKKRFTDRNYELFGLLADGVRSSHPFSFIARGTPLDMCEEVAVEVKGWGEDGHNHSYLYLHEIKDLLTFLDTQKVEISGMKNRKELAALRASAASESPDWDLLYPYCKWSSSGDYEEFSIDVPASYLLGEPLRRIVSSFDGIEGANHRIVFFFDN